MKWNIFNSVSALEQKVKDLTDFSGDHSRWIARLEGKIRQIEDKLFIQAVENKTFSSAPIKSEGAQVFTKAEVNAEENQKLLKRRQYQREWAAKMRVKKMEKAKAQLQREKKNAYARAYYLRTKGKKQ